MGCERLSLDERADSSLLAQQHWTQIRAAQITPDIQIENQQQTERNLGCFRKYWLAHGSFVTGHCIDIIILSYFSAVIFFIKYYIAAFTKMMNSNHENSILLLANMSILIPKDFIMTKIHHQNWNIPKILIKLDSYLSVVFFDTKKCKWRIPKYYF